MRVVHTTPRKINIVGIDDHELTGLNVVTAATLLDTQKGPIIGAFHEYAHLGRGRSIHAACQMEWFNCKVDDRSQHVGGAQGIQTFVTEFRQQLQVQSHLEMPGILVQLGHIQRT